MMPAFELKTLKFHQLAAGVDHELFAYDRQVHFYWRNKTANKTRKLVKAAAWASISKDLLPVEPVV